MTTKRKPKFRIGQVVALRTPFQRDYLRVNRAAFIYCRRKWKYALGESLDLAWWEADFRPLTRREKGY